MVNTDLQKKEDRSFHSVSITLTALICTQFGIYGTIISLIVKYKVPTKFEAERL